MSDKYFATKQIVELLPELEKRIKNYNDYLSRTGRAKKVLRSEQLFFGRHLGEWGVGASTIVDVGAENELTAYGVNLFRNLIKYVSSMTTAQKPEFDAMAEGGDTTSNEQTRLAGKILDYYLYEHRLDRFFVEAADLSLVAGRGHIYITWNPAAGEQDRATGVLPVKDENGNPVLNDDGTPKEKVRRTGDIEIQVINLFDSITDVGERNWSSRKWNIVRTYENKWDLAERHPNQREKIVSQSSDDACACVEYRARRFQAQGSQQLEDMIPVYHFYHKKTDTLPNGRYTKFLNGQVDLYDGPIPYKKIPVFRIVPGQEFDSSEGYTDAFDIMAPQEVLNVLYSIPLANQQAFANPLLYLPQGCEVSPAQLNGTQFNIIKGGAPGTEPKTLNLTATPAELFKNIELVQAFMMKAMGLNSATVGDLGNEKMSGVALARLQEMAVRYSGTFSRQYAYLLEDGGAFILQLLEAFVINERKLEASGSKTPLEFKGEDISQISKVRVVLGNPLKNTPAGIAEFLQGAFDKGNITFKQMVDGLKANSLDRIFSEEDAQPDLIQSENEWLTEGTPVIASVGDGHKAHIKAHKAKMDDPYLRKAAAAGDPQAQKIIAAIQNHIMEHIKWEQTQDPIWFAISGEQPPPMPPPMIPPPPPPGGGPPPPMDGQLPPAPPVS